MSLLELRYSTTRPNFVFWQPLLGACSFKGCNRYCWHPLWKSSTLSVSVGYQIPNEQRLEKNETHILWREVQAYFCSKKLFLHTLKTYIKTIRSRSRDRKETRSQTPTMLRLILHGLTGDLYTQRVKFKKYSKFYLLLSPMYPLSRLEKTHNL